MAIADDTGVILVDHGSKRAEANEMLVAVADQFRRTTGAAIVEPAHMELAEPTLVQAFARCVDQGAKRIVIHPYFLAPGRHSKSDIPEMAAQASRDYPDLPYTVSEPLGLDDRMSEVILRRVEEAAQQLPDARSGA